MQQKELQKLVNSLTENMPPGSNVARHLADVLDVSVESAYRRLRGETTFDLHEVLLLRKLFGISIDGLVDQGETISMRMTPLFGGENSMENYLNDVNNEMKSLCRENPVLYCLSADLPFFRLLAYPKLASFKLFYWNKSILADESLQGVNYEPGWESKTSRELCESIARQYGHYESIEIWNEQTINGTLRQIEYYSDCAFFSSEQQLYAVYSDLLQLILDVAEDARSGYTHVENGSSLNLSYSLWSCELVLDNNSVYIKNDKEHVLALGFNSFNTFKCTHPAMIEEYQAWLNSMLSRSVQLSGQADRHRIAFIQQILERILFSAKKRLASKHIQELEGQVGR